MLPDYIVDEWIKRTIRNVSHRNKNSNTLTNKQKHFYRNQIHYNNKLDESILKTLIKINILPTDPWKMLYSGSYHVTSGIAEV